MQGCILEKKIQIDTLVVDLVDYYNYKCIKILIIKVLYYFFFTCKIVHVKVSKKKREVTCYCKDVQLFTNKLLYKLFYAY